MPDTKSSNSLHWVLGAALLLIGLFVVVALVSVRSQANNESVDTSALIPNAAPVVDSIYFNTAAYTFNDNIAEPIVPNIGSPRNIHITGTVSDPNGDGDITGVNIILHRTALGDTCTADNNDCYHAFCPTQQDAGDADPTLLEYDCNIPLWFYADATVAGGEFPSDSWTASVRVTETSTAAVKSTRVTDVALTGGLDIPAYINYGTMSRGQTTNSGNNQEMVIGQQANDVQDVMVDSQNAMGCTILGSIDIDKQYWNISDAGGTSGTSLSNTPVDTNLAVQYKHDDNNPEVRTLYWDIVIPSSISGYCTGNTTISSTPA